MMSAISGYFIIEDNGIGSIKINSKLRKEFAKKSVQYTCPHCGKI